MTNKCLASVMTVLLALLLIAASQPARASSPLLASTGSQLIFKDLNSLPTPSTNGVTSEANPNKPCGLAADLGVTNCDSDAADLQCATSGVTIALQCKNYVMSQSLVRGHRTFRAGDYPIALLVNGREQSDPTSGDRGAFPGPAALAPSISTPMLVEAVARNNPLVVYSYGFPSSVMNQAIGKHPGVQLRE